MSIPSSAASGQGSGRDAELNDPAMHSLSGGPTAPLRQGHPGGLYLLFVTEMWERFSYYGMKAFLTLYMTATVASGGLGWNKSQSGSVYGWYTGLVYLTPIFGGLMADRVLGTHYSMLLGGSIIALGHFTLAIEQTWSFYAGLLMIVIGTGFFKPCVSVMVGQLYPQNDKRRDAAFTIFYMGINLGAFLGPIICGGLRVGRKHGEVFGWGWAFGAAGVGMVLGLIAYLIGRPFLLKGIGLPPKRLAKGEKRAPEQPLSQDDIQGIIAIFILAFFVFFFWTAFEQAGSSMNFFAEERTDRSLTPATAKWLFDLGVTEGYPMASWLIALIGAVLLGGWIFMERSAKVLLNSSGALRTMVRTVGLAIGPTLLGFGVMKHFGMVKEAFFPDDFLVNAQYPADWFQSVNPFFILTLAPAFSIAWVKLAKIGREPTTPVKMAIGLILLGLGFVAMVMGAQASEQGSSIVKVSGWWLTGAYCIHTVGELFLSPVGLSMVNKLSPPKLVSLLMGVWFLSNFAANKAAGILAGSVDKIAEQQIHLGSFVLKGQVLFYSLFVVTPVLAGIVLLMLSPMIARMIKGRA